MICVLQRRALALFERRSPSRFAAGRPSLSRSRARRALSFASARAQSQPSRLDQHDMHAAKQLRDRAERADARSFCAAATALALLALRAGCISSLLALARSSSILATRLAVTSSLVTVARRSPFRSALDQMCSFLAASRPARSSLRPLLLVVAIFISSSFVLSQTTSASASDTTSYSALAPLAPSRSRGPRDLTL